MLRKFGALCLGAFALLLSVPFSGARAETVLYSFTGSSDGGEPEAGLVMDGKGNLYGTTMVGGPSPGLGTVFKVAPNGTETVLHSFSGQDGEYPVADLIRDSKGNLYGTTQGGGSNDGYGTIFKLTSKGKLTTLYIFTGGNDGGRPEAGLLMDKAGNLYGTAAFYGAHNGGTAFKLAPDGTFTVLWSFGDTGDGANPLAGLIMDKAGNLYGTASYGGAHTFYGAVFKLATNGAESLLYSFGGGSDGGNPYAGLISDSKGNLYGTAAFGGNVSDGVVFKLSPKGKESVLYAFAGGNDGARPVAGLIADKAGNLYSTTEFGGADSSGTVFELAKSGTESVLYSFTGGNDGYKPLGGLVADKSGHLYGTTYQGGTSFFGTVFEVDQ